MKNSIRTVLNKNIIIFTLIIAILLAYSTYITILNLTFKIAENIAEESSSVISTEINSIINKEIYIALNLSKSQEIISWMKEESSKELEYIALSELEIYLEDLRDHNIFLALENSKNFFFLEDEMPKGLSALYQLDKNLESDMWYFNTRDYIDTYDLNVDVDRYLNTIRIWINIKVTEGDEFIGIIGTGIELTPILDDIFAREEHYNSESLIFDSFGAIQLIRDFDKIQENSYGDTDEEKSIFSYSNSDEFKKNIQAFMDAPSKNKIIELDENRRFMILAPIENTDWFMATYYDTNEIFSLMDFTSLLLIIFGLFIMLIIGINWIVKRRVITPIENLNESLLNDSQYGLDRKDEIGNLATTIIDMNKQLRVYSNELEDKYKLQTDLLNSFLDKAPVGVVTIDKDTRVIKSNKHFDAIVSGKDIHLSKLSKASLDMNELLSKGRLIIECLIHEDTFWLELQTLSSQTEEDMDLLITDITEKKLHEMELIKIASVDPLTGIFNRRQLEKLAEAEIYKLERHDTDLSIILFDIDHFKQINDQYGHSIGDRILKEMTSLVSREIRTTDHFARWGGEEFVLLLCNTTLESAVRKAEELRILIESFDFNIHHKITASFGVASFLKHEKYEDAFKRVDSYMYHAKEQGRNKVCSQ